MEKSKLQELELTQEMIERNDEIDNAVYDLILILTENDDFAWDMEIIGEVTDAIKESLAKFKLEVRHPCIITREDGTQCYGE